MGATKRQAGTFRFRDKDVNSNSTFGGRFVSRLRRDSEKGLAADHVTAPREPAVSDSDALALAISQAHRLNPGGGVWDADDIAQSALVSLLERASKAGSWKLRSIRSAVRSTSGADSANAEARLLLDVQVEARQRKLERDLTKAEIAMVGKLILAGWSDVMHRPDVDFYVDYQLLSLSDAQVFREAEAVPAPPAGDESEDWLEDEFEAGVITAEQARKKAWNHFSYDFGLPRAPDELISEGEAAEARRSLDERGGMVMVAHQLVLQGADADWSDALFTPWPFASLEQRKLIAEFLTERVYAGGLWESAMDTATEHAGSGGTIDSSETGDPVFVLSDDQEVLGTMFWG